MVWVSVVVEARTGVWTVRSSVVVVVVMAGSRFGADLQAGKESRTKAARQDKVIVFIG